MKVHFQFGLPRKSLFACVLCILISASQSAMANHGDLWPECPDIEELGSASVQFANIDDLEYIELPPGQSTFTVIADAVVDGGNCQVWAPLNPTNPTCAPAMEPASADINVHTIRELTRPGYWQLWAIDNTTHPQTSTLTADLGPGKHILLTDLLVRDVLCDLVTPDTYYHHATIYIDTVPPKEDPCPPEEDDASTVGNPCNASNGGKYQDELDLESPIAGMGIKRRYSSVLKSDYGLGVGWTTDFLKRLDIGTNLIQARRGNGGSESSVFSGGIWTGGVDATMTLAADASGYTLTLANGNIETYDLTGRLQAETINGYTLSYTYNGTGELQTVSNPFGHTLIFAYDANGRINTITTAGGKVYQYAYDVSGNLTTVTYPDLTVRQYHYEDSNNPNALTGITDETATRFSTYNYDPQLEYVLSTEHAITDNGQPQERHQLAYSGLFGETVDVTDSVGNITSREYQFIHGVKRLKRATNEVDGKYKSLTYDGNGNVLTKRDEEGRMTAYTYNASNQRLTMTEASGTPDARTTSYEYLSPSIDLVTKTTTDSVKAGESKEIAYGYDANRNITSITTTGFDPDGSVVTRTTTLQYNGVGQMTQIDGPRTDVADITVLSYYDCTTGNECGQLQTVTNSLNHVTTFDTYDIEGRVTRTTDPNGLATEYSYDSRGRVTIVSEAPSGGPSQATTFDYDDVGQLVSVTSPAGVALTYIYDAAHDLKTVRDNLGNEHRYQYDLKGNVISEKSFDPQNTLMHAVDTAYDMRNRVDTINTAGSLTDLLYDAVGNLENEVDGNTHPTTHLYDPLDRLTSTIDALTGQTSYAYDENDKFSSVTAPNGVVTSYTHDDLGNTLQEVSPDRGTLDYSYDSAGNVTSMTDSNGVTVVYSYDALNRITLADAPGTEDDIAYSYDTCAFGIGRLCSVVSDSQAVSYAYDAFGNVGGHQQIIYTYTEDNKVETMTYPSGIVVTYSYDLAGQVSQVSLNNGGATTVLADTISYAPFGPLTGLRFGNGLDLSQSYDTAYRITSQFVPSAVDLAYGYDGNGNILSRTDDLSVNSSFTYDWLDRLDTGNGAFGSRDYDYDENGNRIQLTSDGQTTSYGYEPASNRLATETDWDYTRDANGNTIEQLADDGTGRLYSYNSHNRLTTATDRTIIGYSGRGKKRTPIIGDVTLANYAYNGLGQRVSKTLPDGSVTQYLFGINGELLAELDASGAAKTEYVYFNGQLLAVIAVTTTVPDGTGSEIIVDNGAIGTSSVGNWVSDTDRKNKQYGVDYRVAAGGASSSYRWVPTLTPGRYEVFAWWVKDRKAASSVPFTIVHGEGSSIVTVDQTQGGGQWASLGVYEFNAVAGEYIEVDDSNGKTLADAVRLVEEVTGTPQVSTDIYYVHNDHLGTPKALTDTSGMPVWSASHDPFGQATVDADPDGDGNSVSLNVRFPGQYYDVETGLHYNYYRTYEPSTGRYLESDPIGLKGGLNTYGYVNGNPLSFTDPTGEAYVARWAWGAGRLGGRAFNWAWATATGTSFGVFIWEATHDTYDPNSARRDSRDAGRKDYEGVPVPDSAADDLTNAPAETNGKDNHCTRLYVRCVQEGWGGDWTCGQCQFSCTGMNQVWPFEHCSPDLPECRE